MGSAWIRLVVSVAISGSRIRCGAWYSDLELDTVFNARMFDARPDRARILVRVRVRSWVRPVQSRARASSCAAPSRACCAAPHLCIYPGTRGCCFILMWRCDMHYAAISVYGIWYTGYGIRYVRAFALCLLCASRIGPGSIRLRICVRSRSWASERLGPRRLCACVPVCPRWSRGCDWNWSWSWSWEPVLQIVYGCWMLETVDCVGCWSSAGTAEPYSRMHQCECECEAR